MLSPLLTGFFHRSACTLHVINQSPPSVSNLSPLTRTPLCPDGHLFHKPKRLSTQCSPLPDHMPFAQERMKLIESSCRDRSVEENLRLWEEMKLGSETGLLNCMRFKLNMKVCGETAFCARSGLVLPARGRAVTCLKTPQNPTRCGL